MHIDPSLGISALRALSSVGSSVGKYPFFTKLRASRGNMRAMEVSWLAGMKGGSTPRRASAGGSSRYRFRRPNLGRIGIGGEYVTADQGAHRQGQRRPVNGEPKPFPSTEEVGREADRGKGG